MRKIVVLFFTILLIFSTTNSVNAEVSKEGKIKKDVDATTEDILLTIIEPKLEKIIQDKYGHKMSWHVQKVSKVGLIIDHTQKESEAWYEMTLAAQVSDPESTKY
ncbi:hypothetical protein [Peribacillus loiseleuriae]|uniref:hypothetical protein n=1 Tax=Peribacillus loiseleuriae TaxID=1679170 RepID=UPI003D0236FD